MWDMYQYLDAMLLSRKISMSLEKKRDLLLLLGCFLPPLQRLRRILTNIKDFSALRRGETGEQTF